MTKKITFITQFNRDKEMIRDCNVVEFKKPSMVKESLSYATDINTIYDSYCKTGKVPLNGNQPIYDENFVQFDGIIEASKKVEEAANYFKSLPTEIKNKYGNSLVAFTKAIASQDSYLFDKGVLLKKEVKPSIDSVAPVKPSLEPSTQISTPEPSKAVTEPVNTVTTDNL